VIESLPTQKNTEFRNALSSQC